MVEDLIGRVGVRVGHVVEDRVRVAGTQGDERFAVGDGKAPLRPVAAERALVVAVRAGIVREQVARLGRVESVAQRRQIAVGRQADVRVILGAQRPVEDLRETLVTDRLDLEPAIPVVRDPAQFRSVVRHIEPVDPVQSVRAPDRLAPFALHQVHAPVRLIEQPRPVLRNPRTRAVPVGEVALRAILSDKGTVRNPEYGRRRPAVAARVHQHPLTRVVERHVFEAAAPVAARHVVQVDLVEFEPQFVVHPQHCLVARAGDHADALAVVRNRRALRVLARQRDGPYRHVRRQIPELNRRVGRGGHQVAAVAGEAHGGHRLAVTQERLAHLHACRRVHQVREVVARPHRDGLAIGRVRDRVDGRIARHILPEPFLGINVEQHPLALGDDHQFAEVGRGHRIRHQQVGEHRRTQRTGRVQVPDIDRPVAAHRYRRRVVTREARVPHLVVVILEHDEGRVRFGIEHPGRTGVVPQNHPVARVVEPPADPRAARAAVGQCPLHVLVGVVAQTAPDHQPRLGGRTRDHLARAHRDPFRSDRERDLIAVLQVRKVGHGDHVAARHERRIEQDRTRSRFRDLQLAVAHHQLVVRVHEAVAVLVPVHPRTDDVRDFDAGHVGHLELERLDLDAGGRQLEAENRHVVLRGARAEIRRRLPRRALRELQRILHNMRHRIRRAGDGARPDQFDIRGRQADRETVATRQIGKVRDQQVSVFGRECLAAELDRTRSTRDTHHRHATYGHLTLVHHPIAVGVGDQAHAADLLRGQALDVRQTHRQALDLFRRVPLQLEAQQPHVLLCGISVQLIGQLPIRRVGENHRRTRHVTHRVRFRFDPRSRRNPAEPVVQRDREPLPRHHVAHVGQQDVGTRRRILRHERIGEHHRLVRAFRQQQPLSPDGRLFRSADAPIAVGVHHQAEVRHLVPQETAGRFAQTEAHLAHPGRLRRDTEAQQFHRRYRGARFQVVAFLAGHRVHESNHRERRFETQARVVDIIGHRVPQTRRVAHMARSGRRPPPVVRRGQAGLRVVVHGIIPTVLEVVAREGGRRRHRARHPIRVPGPDRVGVAHKPAVRHVPVPVCLKEHGRRAHRVFAIHRREETAVRVQLASRQAVGRIRRRHPHMCRPPVEIGRYVGFTHIETACLQVRRSARVHFQRTHARGGVIQAGRAAQECRISRLHRPIHPDRRHRVHFGAGQGQRPARLHHQQAVRIVRDQRAARLERQGAARLDHHGPVADILLGVRVVEQDLGSLVAHHRRAGHLSPDPHVRLAVLKLAHPDILDTRSELPPDPVAEPLEGTRNGRRLSGIVADRPIRQRPHLNAERRPVATERVERFERTTFHLDRTRFERGQDRRPPPLVRVIAFDGPQRTAVQRHRPAVLDFDSVEPPAVVILRARVQQEIRVRGRQRSVHLEGREIQRPSVPDPYSRPDRQRDPRRNDQLRRDQVVPGRIVPLCVRRQGTADNRLGVVVHLHRQNLFRNHPDCRAGFRDLEPGGSVVRIAVRRGRQRHRHRRVPRRRLDRERRPGRDRQIGVPPGHHRHRQRHRRRRHRAEPYMENRRARFRHRDFVQIGHNLDHRRSRRRRIHSPHNLGRQQVVTPVHIRDHARVVGLDVESCRGPGQHTARRQVHRHLGARSRRQSRNRGRRQCGARAPRRPHGQRRHRRLRSTRVTHPHHQARRTIRLRHRRDHFHRTQVRAPQRHPLLVVVFVEFRHRRVGVHHRIQRVRAHRLGDCPAQRDRHRRASLEPVAQHPPRHFHAPRRGVTVVQHHRGPLHGQVTRVADLDIDIHPFARQQRPGRVGQVARQDRQVLHQRALHHRQVRLTARRHTADGHRSAAAQRHRLGCQGNRLTVVRHRQVPQRVPRRGVRVLDRRVLEQAAILAPHARGRIVNRVQRVRPLGRLRLPDQPEVPVRIRRQCKVHEAHRVRIRPHERRRGLEIPIHHQIVAHLPDQVRLPCGRYGGPDGIVQHRIVRQPCRGTPGRTVVFHVVHFRVQRRAGRQIEFARVGVHGQVPRARQRFRALAGQILDQRRRGRPGIRVRVEPRPVDRRRRRIAPDEIILRVRFPRQEKTSVRHRSAQLRALVQVRVVRQRHRCGPGLGRVVPPRPDDLIQRHDDIQVRGRQVRVFHPFPHRHGVAIAVERHLG